MENESMDPRVQTESRWAAGTEDLGVGKEEPAVAVGVEGLNAAEVRGLGRVTTDQGEAGGTRISGGAEGENSQGRANRSTGQGGAMGSEAGG